MQTEVNGLPQKERWAFERPPACVRAAVAVHGSTAVHATRSLEEAVKRLLSQGRVVLDAILLIRRGRADRPGVGFAQHGRDGGGARDG